MFERFTERARQAIVLAQHEARALGHDHIGSEHLLLGLLREQDGVAARVLTEEGVTLEDVRGRLTPGEAHDVTGQIPFTPAAKKTLELALREALALGHNYIGTEHLLLGISRLDPGEPAADILAGHGLDRETVVNEIIRALSRPGRGPEQGSIPVPKGLDALARALDGAKHAAIERQDVGRAARLRDLERQLASLAAEIADELARS